MSRCEMVVYLTAWYIPFNDVLLTSKWYVKRQYLSDFFPLLEPLAAVHEHTLEFKVTNCAYVSMRIFHDFVSPELTLCQCFKLMFQCMSTHHSTLYDQVAIILIKKNILLDPKNYVISLKIVVDVMFCSNLFPRSDCMQS